MKRTYKIREDLSLEHYGKTLYQIEALVDIPEHNVHKGDIGGYVESYKNLKDNAWVADTAIVFGDAVVYGNARVYGEAKVYGYTTRVYGNAQVADTAIVFGDAVVFDDAVVAGSAEIYGEAVVYGNAHVYGEAVVYGNAHVYGDAEIYDKAVVSGSAQVYDKAVVCGNALVYGDANIIKYHYDYIVFKNWWSSGRHFTWTRSNNMWKVGCFYGTGEELIAKAYKDSKISGDNYKAIVDYVNNVVIPQQNQKSDKGADLFEVYAMYYNCSREEAKSRVFAEVAKYSI